MTDLLVVGFLGSDVKLQIRPTLRLLETLGGHARTPNTMDSWVIGSKGRPR